MKPVSCLASYQRISTLPRVRINFFDHGVVCPGNTVPRWDFARCTSFAPDASGDAADGVGLIVTRLALMEVLSVVGDPTPSPEVEGRERTVEGRPSRTGRLCGSCCFLSIVGICFDSNFDQRGGPEFIITFVGSRQRQQSGSDSARRGRCKFGILFGVAGGKPRSAKIRDVKT